MRTALNVLCLLVGLLPAALTAQRVQGLAVGATVRVDRSEPVRGYVRGTYRERDSVQLVVAALDGANDLIAIPYRDIVSVEVLAWEVPSGMAFRSGAVRGAKVGLVISAALLGLGVLLDERGNCGDCFVSATGLAAGVSIIVFPIATLVGGSRGVAGRERWVAVPFRP